MSIKVMSQVMRDPAYHGKQKLILIAIADAVDNNGVGFASYRQIKQVADVTDEYLRRMIRRFIDDGRLEILSKGQGPGKATVYRVILPNSVGELGEQESPQLPNSVGEFEPDEYAQLPNSVAENSPTQLQRTPQLSRGELPNSSLYPPLHTSPLEAPSLETSPLLGADLVNPPRRKASRRLHSVREDSPTQVDLSGQKEITFEQFWQAYPRKVGKGKAREAYAKALRITDPATLTDQARRYAQSVQGKDQQYVAHPTTWLNQERWEDVYPDHGELPDGWYRRPDGNLLDPVGTLWGEMPGGRLVAL